jgi:hypothetical protein
MYCNCNELASATVNNTEIVAKSVPVLMQQFARAEAEF